MISFSFRVSQGPKIEQVVAKLQKNQTSILFCEVEELTKEEMDRLVESTTPTRTPKRRPQVQSSYGSSNEEAGPVSTNTDKFHGSQSTSNCLYNSLSKFVSSFTKPAKQTSKSSAADVKRSSSPESSDVQTGTTDHTSLSHRKSARISSQKKEKVVKPNVKLLYYKPKHCKEGVQLMTEDVDTLEPGEYLNDKIMNFYLKYMMFEMLEEELQKRLHIFSSFFYTRLSNASMDNKALPMSAPERFHNRVRNWTKHVDLFSKDYIVIPVCDRAHWFVILICYPGKFDPNKVPTKKPRPKTRTRQSLKRKRSTRRQSKIKRVEETPGGTLTLCSSSGGETQEEGTEDEAQLEEDMDLDKEEALTNSDLEGGCKEESPLADPLHVGVYNNESEVVGAGGGAEGGGVDVEETGLKEGEEPMETASVEEEAMETANVDNLGRVMPLEHTDEKETVTVCDTPPSSPPNPSQSYPLYSPVKPLANPVMQMWAGSTASSDVGMANGSDVGVANGGVTSDVGVANGGVGGASSEGSESSPEFVKEAEGDHVTVQDSPQEAPVKVKQEKEEVDESLMPRLLILDSLGVRRPTSANRVRQYLTEEWKAKKKDVVGLELKFDSLPVKYPLIPLQHNSSDCGIFVLQYVETLVMCLKEGKALPHAQDSEGWGDLAHIKEKRQKIESLIRDRETK